MFPTGSAPLAGSTTDDTAEVILVTSGGDSSCRLLDSSNHTYQLQAINLSPASPTDCVLRVEDSSDAGAGISKAPGPIARRPTLPASRSSAVTRTASRWVKSRW